MVLLNTFVNQRDSRDFGTDSKKKKHQVNENSKSINAIVLSKQGLNDCYGLV